MQSPYPSRYRVIERGRRLITIDTLNGEEIGAKDRPPIDMPQAQTNMTLPRSAMVVKMEEDALDSPPPERPPLSEARAGLVPRPAAKIQGKLPLIIIGGIALVIFLIVTNLWIGVVIAMLIPPVRAAVFAQAKTALKKLFDQAATG